MIPTVTLPPDLIAAASSLETRLRLLSVPTRKVPLAEWSIIQENLQFMIPNWLPTLLANFSLYGSVLECPHDYENRWWRNFCFWGPEEYQQQLSDEGYCFRDEFVGEGLIMISDESDGDMWLTSIAGGPSSPIYLFSLTGHEKVFASSRMALLLASMAVSGESFWNFGNTGPYRSVMWYPEKP